MLGPLFIAIAKWVDLKPVRIAYGVLLALTGVLLGPFTLIVASAGFDEPVLGAIGIGGIGGLAGAAVRIRLGPSFFALSAWARAWYVMLLVAGVASAAIATFATLAGLSVFAVAPVAALAGVVLILGSIRLHRAGPNNSSKPTPLRGAA